jgi:hypothetical protein
VRELKGRENDHENELAGLAFKALDEGLRSVLGESVTKALYHHFEERTGLKVREALERPEGSRAFTRFLREFFDHGYDALEKVMVEVLNKRVGIRASSLFEALSLLGSRSTKCLTCLKE